MTKGGKMALINTVSPDKAEGDIQKGYALFLDRGVEVPAPLQLLSASPEMFKIMIQRNIYYSKHPNLSFALLAHIRYFVAKKLDYGFCQLFNKKLLMMLGVDEESIEQMGTDPEKSFIEENERQMLSFVLNAMDDPDSIARRDIYKLHDAGWTDTDIFDALAQGVGMIDHHIFMRVFKPEPEKK
jgi:hypothetical protein